MKQPQLYVRSVVANGVTKTYSKKFDFSESGLRDGDKYSANKKPKSVRGEALNCIINKNNKSIRIITDNNFPVGFILIKGTYSLSKVKGTYNNTGSFYRGFGDIIRDILEAIPHINKFTIEYYPDSVTQLKKKHNKSHLILSSFDYNYIHGLFSAEKKKLNESAISSAFRFLRTKLTGLTNFKKAGKDFLTKDFKNQLFQEALNNLTEKEVHKLLFELYNKHYSIIKNKLELFKQTDTYKLDYIISEYNKYLKAYRGDEKKWQTFFEDNFNIINPSYKYVIREVDTIFKLFDVEAESRPIDFIAVDIYNNVELIELKTPDSDLLSKRKDRNNYYLTHNCTKACTQIEKYLICIESNKAEIDKLLKQKISEKYGVKRNELDLVIVKPKAKLIIGLIEPILKNISRHQDFQLQRHSFKNMEIVTFDEILGSLVEVNNELKRKGKKKINR